MHFDFETVGKVVDAVLRGRFQPRVSVACVKRTARSLGDMHQKIFWDWRDYFLPALHAITSKGRPAIDFTRLAIYFYLE